ncbi:MAG: hypothetical protein AAGM84_05420 [Pseudomonadota bacterium]
MSRPVTETTNAAEAEHTARLASSASATSAGSAAPIALPAAFFEVPAFTHPSPMAVAEGQRRATVPLVGSLPSRGAILFQRWWPFISDCIGAACLFAILMMLMLLPLIFGDAP